MKKYTLTPAGRIMPFEIVKETPGTLVILREREFSTQLQERRVMKSAFPVFDTWADARQELINRQHLRIAAAEKEIERAREMLAKAKAMQEPTE